MASFLSWVRIAITQIFDLLGNVIFSFGNSKVSLLSLILSLFIIAFVISVFWKGAQK